MRLALLCDDATVVPWLDAIAGDPIHEIVLAVTSSPRCAELLRGRSGIRLTPHWEDLLGGKAFDAILVGGSDATMLEAIKQLASAGQKLLFLPAIDQGSTFVYELSLIRDDNHVSITPAIWHRCDPALVRTREIIRSATLGKVQLLQFQREISSGSSLVAQADINRALLSDIDLLRWLVGDYDQVTALRTGASDAGVLTQSVKLAGKSLPEATWDARAGKSSQSRLTIHAEQGTAAIERDPQSQEWVLIDAKGERLVGNCSTAIRDFLSQLDAGTAGPVEWQELVKGFETVDATGRSVTRRRTIELHFEPMSERAIFKTQMTAIGCSVLIATLMLVMVYLAIASTIPLPPAVLILLRTLVFAPLGIFLLLQLLYPLTRPSEGQDGVPSER